jgi:hypothetical protein
MQYTQDSGAARASATVNKLGDTAKTLCQVSQFKLQQQGLEALVAHRDWSEAAMKRTSWRVSCSSLPDWCCVGLSIFPPPP